MPMEVFSSPESVAKRTAEPPAAEAMGTHHEEHGAEAMVEAPGAEAIGTHAEPTEAVGTLAAAPLLIVVTRCIVERTTASPAIDHLRVRSRWILAIDLKRHINNRV